MEREGMRFTNLGSRRRNVLLRHWLTASNEGVLLTRLSMMRAGENMNGGRSMTSYPTAAPNNHKQTQWAKLHERGRAVAPTPDLQQISRRGAGCRILHTTINTTTIIVTDQTRTEG